MVAAFVSGAIAIGVLLRYLRSGSLDVFVWYRLLLAAVVVIVWLGR
jgi:undecaprenyl pyrophosphate phosphatase UppP